MESSRWVETLCIAAVASATTGERSAKAEGRIRWEAPDVAAAVAAWQFVMEIYGLRYTAD